MESGREKIRVEGEGTSAMRKMIRRYFGKVMNFHQKMREIEILARISV